MKKYKSAWIAGICTIVAAIVTGLIGIQYGEYHQNKYVQSQVANVNGDGNTVVINDVQDLTNEYLRLKSNNETAEAERDQYFKDYTDALEENEAIKAQLEDAPIIELKNLGLTIDGNEIKINEQNSYAMINGREYFSKDFLNNIIALDTTTMSIQNDVLYLGKITTDNENLLNQRIVDFSSYKVANSVTDSYGN